MCGPSPDGPASDAGVPGSPPAGTTGGTGLCCACPADKDVSTNGSGTYFSTTYVHSNSLTNKCHVDIVRTATAGTITIKKKFKLSYTAGATEAANKAAVTAAITSAISAWNTAASSHKIKIEQPGCDPQNCDIKYESEIVASGEDVSVSVDGTPAPAAPAAGLRSYVSGGTAMTFYINGVGAINWTMIHEIGHTYGLCDEYIFTHPNNTAPSFTYKGADDPAVTKTLATSSIAAFTAGTFAFDRACVMGQNGNTTYPKYLFHWIAIEVKAILAGEATLASVKVT